MRGVVKDLIRAAVTSRHKCRKDPGSSKVGCTFLFDPRNTNVTLPLLYRMFLAIKNRLSDLKIFFLLFRISEVALVH